MPLRFSLTIPPDAHFLAAVRQLADRVAQCSGFTAADAQDIASTVLQAVEGALTRTAGRGDHEGLDIRFERDETHLDIWLRYRNGDADLSSSDAPGRDAAAQTGEHVETGREGAMSYWRLRRPLPHEKVNHQCEMPPER